MSSFVSANHAWWHPWGEEVKEAPFIAEIQLVNTAPIIDSWTVPDADSVLVGLQPYIPTCAVGGATTSIGGAPGTAFTVTVSDTNGCEDVRGNGVVTVQFSKGGVNRPAVAATCVAPGTCTGNAVSFTCNSLVAMQHYDLSGSDWVMTFTATDGAVSATNSPKLSDGTANYPFFTYGTSLCIELQDDDDPTVPLDTIYWTGVSTGTIDLQAGTGPDNSYMRVFNRGNVNLESTALATDDDLQMRAEDLLGVTDPAYGIDQTSFSVDERSSAYGGHTACDNAPTTEPTCPCNDGDAGYTGQGLTTTLTRTTGAALALATDAGSSNVPLYFCIESIVLPGGQVGLPAQVYRTQSSPNDWQISACEVC